MRQYKSHKIVTAAPLTGYFPHEDGGAHIVVHHFDEDTNDGEIYITKDENSRFKIDTDDLENADLGYLVVYEDGYRSWSPTKAFEEGYKPARSRERPPALPDIVVHQVKPASPFILGVVEYGKLIYALLAVWGFLVTDFQAVAAVLVAAVFTYFNMLACHMLYDGEYPKGVNPRVLERLVPVTGFISWGAVVVAMLLLTLR